MIEEPKAVDVPGQDIAYIHLEIPRSEMMNVMGPAIGEVTAAVQAQRIGTTAPWFTHHLSMSASTFDFDVCLTVSAPVSDVGRVRAGVRPPQRVLRTIYHGPYEGLGDAWHEFDAWADANGLKTASDLYESYVAGPDSGLKPNDWETELSRPLLD